MKSLAKKKPFIIMVGHEKGGTGKSTLTTHLAVGLLHSNKNETVAVLDLDKRQSGSYAFFKTRSEHKIKIPIPKFDCISSSSKDSKADSFEEDLNNLKAKLHAFYDCNYIIIDTAGSYTNFVVAALFFADLLITPVTESFLDINAIVRFDESEMLLNGPFADVVFNQKKIRARDNLKELHWALVINRASNVNHENSQNCLNLLNKIQRNLNFDICYKIYDRIVYKELFQHGLTIFDLPHLTSDISLLKIKAHEEMTGFVSKIGHIIYKIKQNEEEIILRERAV
jgi:chromosome partitioning protein